MNPKLLYLLLCLSLPVWSIDVIEFEDPVERERYQRLTYELRCPKCQNQNLIDSDSQISEDLRKEVARLIHEGKNDEEIKTQMVALYGDFILYRPPVQNNTLVLWAGPVIMIGIGLLIFATILVRRVRAGDSDEEGGIETGMEDDLDESHVGDGEISPEESASSSGNDEQGQAK